MALLEWCMYEIMYEITVNCGFLALINTSLIMPNFTALQIPSDNNMLQASISTADEHFITLSPVIILRPARSSRSIKQMT